MSQVVSALTDSSTGITGTALWGDVAAVMPFVITIFIFAFAYRILRKSLKGGSKAKVNI